MWNLQQKKLIIVSPFIFNPFVYKFYELFWLVFPQSFDVPKGLIHICNDISEISQCIGTVP
jgi:hypothetical protein